MQSFYFKLFFLITLLSLAFQINAEELSDKLKFRLGTFFIGSTETEVQLNSGSLVGAIINISDNLNVDTKKDVLRLDGYYRFSDKHRLDYGWYKLNSSGTKTLSKDIDYNGETFPAGGTVNSIFNTETFKVNYTWSFHHDDKIELSLGTGLHVTKYEIVLSGETLSAPGVVSREESDVTLPLPVIGFRLGYMINPNLEFTTSYDLFSLSYDQYEGNFQDVNFLLEYRFSKHVGISGGFNFNHLDLTYREGQTTLKVNDSVRGAVLFMTLTY